jgi:FKBP-type peptidyl-prolyl cis-trans isomerase FklB
MRTLIMIIFGFSCCLHFSVMAISSDATFLEENQKKLEIHTLPSGLQYKIVQEGVGTTPGPTDFVQVHYRGTLVDGTEFDSSYAQSTPTTFAVNAVIPGWSEALQLMNPGSKWTLYIPPKLAYGKNGAGRFIGPNATLIFDVELLAVKSTDIPSDNLPEEEEG